VKGLADSLATFVVRAEDLALLGVEQHQQLGVIARARRDHVERADAHQRDLQREAQPFRGRQPHPNAGERAWADADREHREVLGLQTPACEHVGQVRQECLAMSGVDGGGGFGEHQERSVPLLEEGDGPQMRCGVEGQNAHAQRRNR